MRQIIVVAGPTAVGKTKYAIAIAKAVGGEIVSCDSMQLYKYMNIGSAKPTAEEQREVKHYLVDEIDPREPFSVAKYRALAKQAIEEIFQGGKVPVIKYSEGQSLVFECEHCGKQFSIRLGKSKVKALRKEENLEEEAELFGSAYLHKKLEAIDPKTAARIHPNNTKKLIRALEGAANGNPITDFQQCRQKCKDYDAILIGLTRNRDVLYDRINQRVDIMVREGLFKEVENLLEMGLAEEDISMKGIGYKEIIGYFDGLYTEDEAIDLIKKNSRHLAKRQLTWFRRYEDMTWFDLDEYQNDEDAIRSILLWLKEKYGYTIKVTDPTM